MKKKSGFFGIIAAGLVLSLTLIGCGTTASNAPSSTAGPVKQSDFKVGLVTDVGGLNDHSFNFLANKGLERAKKELGVQTAVVQSKQMTDYEMNLTNFAQQKYNLVIAVGFLMHDAVVKIAKQFPDTKFMIIDSEVAAKDQPKNNVSSAMFKTEQCGYLVGVMAGSMEKTSGIPNMLGKNTVGVVGGMAIPPVNDYIAGFIQGAKSVDPGIKILVKYTGKFDDPAGGKTMALTMIGQGADILFPVAGGTGNGVIDAAKEKKVYAIGVDADQNYLAPATVITSALKGVDTATYDVIKATKDGNFKSGDVFFDLANDGVGYAPPIKAVPESVVTLVKDAAAKIKSGAITVTNTMPKGYGQ
ncbi:membrane lipoprotein TmpC precursor [Peptococcaceae bacterium CEB3]|nr:membrane lipoprotein TmpC precursor [Peptococcaceae bacterium CEB3]